MNIFVYGTARMASQPETVGQVICAKVVGTVKLGAADEARFGCTGARAVVKSNSSSYWVVEEIDDLLILDDRGMPIDRGADIWDPARAESRKYGLRRFSPKALPQLSCKK